MMTWLTCKDTMETLKRSNEKMESCSKKTEERMNDFSRKTDELLERFMLITTQLGLRSLEQILPS